MHDNMIRCIDLSEQTKLYNFRNSCVIRSDRYQYSLFKENNELIALMLVPKCHQYGLSTNYSNFAHV